MWAPPCIITTGSFVECPAGLSTSKYVGGESNRSIVVSAGLVGKVMESPLVMQRTVQSSDGRCQRA